MERTKKIVIKEPELISKIEEVEVEQKVDLKEPEPEEVIPILKWKKIGGGGLHWNHRIIKPGETFEAREEDLPKAFIKDFICLNPEDRAKVIAVKKKKEEILEVLYTIKPTVDGMYDIVSNKGKRINEQLLTLKQAKELKQALES